MNALKHGLMAKTPVLPGEDAEEYEHLKKSAYHHYNAGTTFEKFRVDRLVNALWQQRRAEQIDTGMWKLAAGTVPHMSGDSKSATASILATPLHAQLSELNRQAQVAICNADDPRDLRLGACAVSTDSTPGPTIVEDPPDDSTGDQDLDLACVFQSGHASFGQDLEAAARNLERAEARVARAEKGMAAVEVMRERLHKAHIRDFTSVKVAPFNSPNHVHVLPRVKHVPDPDQPGLCISANADGSVEV